MIEGDDEFINLVDDFLESSREIRRAAEMCDGDPIKQDMIAHIAKEFTEVWQRSEALQVLMKKDYENCREYILQEIKEITAINYDIARRIKNKLKPIVWN
jgi:hypothetical protein